MAGGLLITRKTTPLKRKDDFQQRRTSERDSKNSYSKTTLPLPQASVCFHYLCDYYSMLYSLLLRVAKLCRVSSLQKNLFNHLAKFKHLFNRTVIGSKPQQYIQDVPTSFGQEFSEKSLDITKGEKIRESLLTSKLSSANSPSI